MLFKNPGKVYFADAAVFRCGQQGNILGIILLDIKQGITYKSWIIFSPYILHNIEENTVPVLQEP